MKYLKMVLILLVTLSTRLLGSGGLECINDDLPTPMCTQPSSVNSQSLGFGASAELNMTVNTATGNARVAFAAGGSFPLGQSLTVSHNSRDNRVFPMGVGRNHRYNVMLLERPDEWPETPIRIVLSTGGRINYDLNLDGTYRGQPGVFSRLIKQTDGSYRIYTNESVDMVDDGSVCYDFGPADSTGRARLRSITYSTDTITFTYVTSGYGLGEVSRVKEGSTGREACFTYDYKGRVKTITSLDSVVTTFSYNPFSDMIQAVSSWGTLTFSIDYDHNIQSITDGLGGHSAGIAYVDTARCATIRDTNGVFYDFSYVIDDMGAVQSTSFGIRGEAPTTYEITANMLVASITTPLGGKTCYTYSADKCTTGSSTCSLPGAIKLADASQAAK